MRRENFLLLFFCSDLGRGCFVFRIGDLQDSTWHEEESVGVSEIFCHNPNIAWLANAESFSLSELTLCVA